MSHLITPSVLDLFVRALVNEVDYDIHKGYECGEEDGADHYPELVAEAAKMLDAIVASQAGPVTIPAEVAAHVLFQERLGGWPPSTFTTKLLDTWTSADTPNAERLAVGFPEYGAAIALMRSGGAGVEQLRAIADASVDF